MSYWETGVDFDTFFYDPVINDYRIVRRKRGEVEKKREIINDDEEENMIMNKKSSIFDTMKPLEKSEIELGIVSELEKAIFSDYKKEDQPVSSFYHKTSIRRMYVAEGLEHYIVIGYRFGNKVVESQNEALSMLNNMQILTDYITYCLEKKTIKLHNRRKFERHTEGVIGSSRNIILEQFFKYKIVSSALSSRVFGLPTTKKELEGSLVNVKFDRGFSNRLNSETFYAIVTDKAGKNVKFCIADLKIQMPNVKGYNFPKDKTINVGSTIQLKGKDVNYVVLQTYPNKTSKKLNKNSETRQLDVLCVRNVLTNEQDKIYAKNVKKVL